MRRPPFLRLLLLLALLPLLLATALLGLARLEAARRESQSPAQAAPPGGRFVQTRTALLHFQESGPASGEPVLLIHGTGAWSELWRLSLDALGRAGYHAIALDLPPFGYSERTPGVPAYSCQAQARKILDLLDALKLPRVILVGHSVGARPTVEAALLAPERVERLVLVDPALGFPADPSAPPQFEQAHPAWPLRCLFALRPLRNAVFAASATNPRLLPRLFASFVSRKEAVTPERLQVLRLPLAVEGTTAAYGDWLAHLMVEKDPSLGSDFGHLRALTMPTLLIWGRTDTVTPLWQGERLKELIPQAQLQVLDGVGHIPYIEDPDGFHRLLFRFLLKGKNGQKP